MQIPEGDAQEAQNEESGAVKVTLVVVYPDVHEKIQKLHYKRGRGDLERKLGGGEGANSGLGRKVARGEQDSIQACGSPCIRLQ